MHVRLPALVPETGLPAFLARLGRANGRPAAALDLRGAARYAPAAVTAIVAATEAWRAAGATVRLRGLSRGLAVAHLDRLHLFAQLGQPLPRRIRRTEPAARIAPLQRVRTPGREVEHRSIEVPSALFPEQVEAYDLEETGTFDLVSYVVQELLRNVTQHARGEGYVCAEVDEARDRIHVGVADRGMGVRRRLAFAGLLPDDADDLDALRMAMRPGVSSGLALQGGWSTAVNAGVGIPIMRELAILLDGDFVIASGNAAVGLDSEARWKADGAFAGTVVGFSARRSVVGPFLPWFAEAKRRIGADAHPSTGEGEAR